MAFFKTFLLLGLAFAVVLLISSEVSARELAETTQSQTNVEESNYGDNHGYGYGKGHGHGGHGHGGHGHGHGHGGHGHHGGEKLEVETQGGDN